MNKRWFVAGLVCLCVSSEVLAAGAQTSISDRSKSESISPTLKDCMAAIRNQSRSAEVRQKIHAVGALLQARAPASAHRILDSILIHSQSDPTDVAHSAVLKAAIHLEHGDFQQAATAAATAAQTKEAGAAVRAQAESLWARAIPENHDGRRLAEREMHLRAAHALQPQNLEYIEQLGDFYMSQGERTDDSFQPDFFESAAKTYVDGLRFLMAGRSGGEDPRMERYHQKLETADLRNEGIKAIRSIVNDYERGRTVALSEFVNSKEPDEWKRVVALTEDSELLVDRAVGEMAKLNANQLRKVLSSVTPSPSPISDLYAAISLQIHNLEFRGRALARLGREKEAVKLLSAVMGISTEFKHLKVFEGVQHEEIVPIGYSSDQVEDQLEALKPVSVQLLEPRKSAVLLFYHGPELMKAEDFDEATQPKMKEVLKVRNLVLAYNRNTQTGMIAAIDHPQFFSHYQLENLLPKNRKVLGGVRYLATHIGIMRKNSEHYKTADGPGIQDQNFIIKFVPAKS